MPQHLPRAAVAGAELLLQAVYCVLEELNPVVRGLQWGAEEGAPSPRAPMLICFPSGSSSPGRETRALWQKKLMEQLSNVPKTGRSTGQELQSSGAVWRQGE